MHQGHTSTQRIQALPGRASERAFIGVSVLALMASMAIRLPFFYFRAGPFIVGDEIGYLANARSLGGGSPSDLAGIVEYKAGYSLFLILPLRIFTDPAIAYRASLALGALLSAMTFVLLLLLLRECGVERSSALLAALVGSATSDVLFMTSYTMSEVVLAPLCVAILYATVKGLSATEPVMSARWIAAAGGIGGLLAATHVRGLMILAVVVLLVLSRGTTLPRRSLVAGIVALGSSLAVGHVANQYATSQNWPGGGAAEFKLIFFSRDAIIKTAMLIIGQTWYMTVSTLGIFLVGAAVLARHALNAKGSLRVAAQGSLGFFLAVSSGVAVVAPTVAVSSNWYVYGRYVAVVGPLFVAFAVAWTLCVARRTFAKIFAGVAVATLVMLGALLVYVDLEGRIANPMTVPALYALAHFVVRQDAFARGSLPMLPATFAALAAFTAVALQVAARWSRIVPLFLLVGFLAMAMVSSDLIVRRQEPGFYPEGRSGMDYTAITDSRSSTWDTALDSDFLARYRYQYFTRASTPERVDLSTSSPTTEIVIAAKDWDGFAAGYASPEELPDIEALVWRKIDGGS